MSVLSSLLSAYARLPDAPPMGMSREKIGAVMALNPDGTVAGLHDVRDLSGKKPAPARLQVPQPVKRTAGISPNFLWDKTAYALGVTAGTGKRTADEHAAFRARHADWLAGSDDEGLLAFTRFLDRWRPEDFTWDATLLDQNVIFVLESDRMARIWLHDRPAARALWDDLRGAAGGGAVRCLASGRRGPVARLHPSIKGVWGAQSAGASLVSFNLDAFTSYGHEQGDNAPVSEESAFAYTAALNRLLAKGSGNRVQVGDASVVFWADTDDAMAAAAANAMFAGYVEANPAEEDAAAARDIALKLERIRKGAPLAEVEPALAAGVRFTVLGLAPNAARLSVRFLVQDSFDHIAIYYRQWQSDIAVEPLLTGGPGSIFRQLCELLTQPQKRRLSYKEADEYIRKYIAKLAGEYFRAILTGGRYPMTLLTTTLIRIRADGRINDPRVGMMKAVLIRNFDMEVPMALNPEFDNTGYQLGRLFAVYEQIQYSALGSVNASIRDKYYGSASATPQQVFGMLDKGAQTHLSKVAKQNKGRAVNLERALHEVMDRLVADDSTFPKSLAARDQALFALGYHHQRSAMLPKKTDDTPESPEVTE